MEQLYHAMLAYSLAYSTLDHLKAKYSFSNVLWSNLYFKGIKYIQTMVDFHCQIFNVFIPIKIFSKSHLLSICAIGRLPIFHYSYLMGRN